MSGRPTAPPAGGSPRSGARAVAEQQPGPATLWIRYVPRTWPLPSSPWTHPAASALGSVGGPPRPSAETPGDPSPFDDLLWVPPVDAADEPRRDSWLAAIPAGSGPLLVQVRPGRSAPVHPDATPLWDLLAPAVRGEVAALATLPAGAAAVWPLLPGRASDPAWIDEACGVLAAAGVAAVQAQLLDVPATARRDLVAWLGDEAAFDELFHGVALDERAFARIAARHGLAPLVPRPALPGGDPPNRRLAAALATIAELWLRLGRPLGRGGELTRAAHWVDRSPYDLATLRREGNLGVVPWLDAASREAVEEILASGRSRLLEELTRAYLEEDSAS